MGDINLYFESDVVLDRLVYHYKTSIFTSQYIYTKKKKISTRNLNCMKF